MKLRGGPIWRMPVEGGEETLVLDQDVPYSYWRVLEKGICFLSQAATPLEIDFLDFASTQVKQISTVDRAKGGTSHGGFAVSPDGRWILFARTDQNDGD